MAEMIYHATIGSLDEAWSAVGVALTEARRLDSPPALAQTLRRCAHVANRCGETDAGLRYLYEAVEIAESNHLVAHAIQACGFISERLVHDLDITSAEAWYARVRMWLAVAGNPLSSSNSRWTAAKLALFRQDVTSAAAALTESATDITQIVDVRRRLECMALHVHLSVQQGSASLRSELATEMEATFDAIKSLGGVDYAALALLTLRSRTNPEMAADWLRDYAANHRRERGLLPLMLRLPLEGRNHSSAVDGAGSEPVRGDITGNA
jgi:hypothetical protein